jgi:hypothetical protein
MRKHISFSIAAAILGLATVFCVIGSLAETNTNVARLVVAHVKTVPFGPGIRPESLIIAQGVTRHGSSHRQASDRAREHRGAAQHGLGGACRLRDRRRHLRHRFLARRLAIRLRTPFMGILTVFFEVDARWRVFLEDFNA